MDVLLLFMARSRRWRMPWQRWRGTREMCGRQSSPSPVRTRSGWVCLLYTSIAAHFRDTLEDRRALRGYVVDEVKRTNGQIRFEDAQDVQRQLPDDTWRD